MQTLRLREKVASDGFIHIKVPADFGPEIDLVIRPHSAAISPESVELMALQQQNAFSATVLAADSEDVWNDL